jgi:hypothetical protein
MQMNSSFVEVKLREEVKWVSVFRQQWALGYRYMTRVPVYDAGTGIWRGYRYMTRVPVYDAGICIWPVYFPLVQTGPGAHPASCTMCTDSFPGVKRGRGVLLTTHPLLASRSWNSRDIPLPPLGHKRTCNGVTLPYRYMTPFWSTERNLLLPAFFYSKDKGCSFFRNVCCCISSYTTSHNGSPWSEIPSCRTIAQNRIPTGTLQVVRWLRNSLLLA